ncbi:MAG: TatD family hydrolase [Bacteroidales bacterium]
MLIDTHTHIYLPHFRKDAGSMMLRAKQAGVEKMILPNIDTGSIREMLYFTASYPGRLHSMMGLHPGSVDENYKTELDIIYEYLDSGGFVGIGEIGMDLYWDTTYRKQQEDAFVTQCRWAAEKNLPVSIHSRDATAEVLDLLSKMKNPPRGIFHCFAGNISQAMEVINIGFKIGVGGVVTFKNSKLPNVLEKIAPENLVLETDAPYLAPHPNRGKRNEPAMLSFVANKLAEVYSLPVSEIEARTSSSALQCFGL